MPRTSGQRLRAVALLLLSAGVAGDLGCTRSFFRNRADANVDQLLTEKNKYAWWKIENWYVYPDIRARFADPTDPDRPPMPPDDPAAHDLSPNPQAPGKAGVALIEGTGYIELMKAWDVANRQREADEAKREAEKGSTPDTFSTLTDPADRGYLLTLDQACELALINSREFQDQRENLYLTALPVSLQRFSFAAQFFGIGNVIRRSTGSQTLEGRSESWSGGASAGVSELFPTGALLAFKMANQFAINLIGSGPHTTSLSNLSLELSQPLLRGGGLAVTMEPLTQAERNLLYAIRAYARFRKQFYVSLATGSSTSGGIDVSGLSASGSLDISNLTGGGFSGSGGFLTAVQRAGNLDIDRRNVTALEGFLRQFEAFKEGGDISQLQVDQVKQNLLSAQATVLSDEQQLRTSLDQFKIKLGIPTGMPLEVDLTPLKPLTRQLNRYQLILDQYRKVQEEVENTYGRPEDADKLRARLHSQLTDSDLVKGTRFRETISGAWGAWEKRTAKELDAELTRLRSRRRVLLDEKTKLETQNKPVPQAMNEQIDAIEDDINLGLMEQSLREYEAKPWLNPKTRTLNPTPLFRAVVDYFELVLVAPRTERFESLRKDWPKPPRVCVEGVDLIAAPLEEAYTKAAQTALTYRFDLMNTRAQLVDSWREIAVRANALQGVLDVRYNLDSSTPSTRNEPFGFSLSRTRNSLEVNGELPLVRRLERNNYRTALIAYQRERRNLQSTEDQILLSVRNALRQLRVLEQTYVIQQEQVALAYSLVENSLDTISAPSIPGQGSTAGNAAALTQQLLGNQSSLNRAQQNLYSIWINYLVTRMSLYRDLELLPLDCRGVWIDEHATCECPPEPRSAREGPDRLTPDPEPGVRELPPVTLPAPRQVPEPR